MKSAKTLDTRTRRNWHIDAVLMTLALGAAVTGIYFLFLPSGGYQGGRNPAYGATILFERHTWSDLHTWSGTVMIAVAVLHIVLHWSWVVSMTRRLAHGMRSRHAGLSRGSRINLAVNAAIGLSFAVAAVTGVYLLFAPSGGYRGGATAGWDPGFLFARSTWDLAHTWSGTAFAIAGLLHFAIHWRWVTKVTSRIVTLPRWSRDALRAPVQVDA